MTDVTPDLLAPPSRDAVAALVFAIFGWTVFPAVGWVLAYIYADRAHRLARQHPDRYGGLYLADAATSISFVGLWFLFLAVVVTGVVLGVLIGHGS